MGPTNTEKPIIPLCELLQFATLYDRHAGTAPVSYIWVNGSHERQEVELTEREGTAIRAEGSVTTNFLVLRGLGTEERRDAGAEAQHKY